MEPSASSLFVRRDEALFIFSKAITIENIGERKVFMNITLKGGIVREFASGMTAGEIAKEISGGLYRSACAAVIDAKVVDLRTPIEEDCALSVLTFEDEEGKKAFWHTASHILAQAVKRLYPAAKLTIGPAIDSGFYYDFDTPTPFTPVSYTHLDVYKRQS